METLKGSRRLLKKGRVNLSAVMALTAVMTLLAPISPVHAPSLDPASAVPVSFREYANFMGYLQYRWNAKEFSCLDNIWTRESHWNPKAKNKNSTAYGIAQKLNETDKNGMLQIRNGMRYIYLRYKTPCNAWAFWKRHYWY